MKIVVSLFFSCVISVPAKVVLRIKILLTIKKFPPNPFKGAPDENYNQLSCHVSSGSSFIRSLLRHTFIAALRTFSPSSCVHSFISLP